MTTVDYASVFELEIRPRRRVRRAAALALWTGLLLVRPGLARQIWRERREPDPSLQGEVAAGRRGL